MITHKIRRREGAGRLCSPDELSHILERRRSLSDRGGNGFSFVVFEVDDTPVADAAILHLARLLASRLRFTDEIGWLDQRQLCAVLPDTNADGACKLVNDICETPAGIASAPLCKVYTYPLPGTCARSETSRFYAVAAIVNGPVISESEDSHLHLTDPAVSLQQALADESVGEESVREMEALLFHQYPLWKRITDIVGSLVGIFLTTPMMALIAVAVKLTSAGPVFYMQKRIGCGGRPFMMFKFRSMTASVSDAPHEQYIKDFMNGTAEKNDDGTFKLKNDPRLTSLGRFLRKWSLDELPQFFNVLKGDMSLVGPRPDPWYAAAHYAPWYHLRTMTAKPGITGLWQVEGRSQVTYEEMIRMDIRYGQSISFVNDFKLMLRTFKVVFSHVGAY